MRDGLETQWRDRRSRARPVCRDRLPSGCGGAIPGLMLAVLTAGCGAASLATQRSSAAVANPNGIVCVRPEEDTAYEADGAATVQGISGKGRVRERFRVVESPRQACQRHVARQLFGACQEFANGLITREEYLRLRAQENERCDRLR